MDVIETLECRENFLTEDKHFLSVSCKGAIIIDVSIRIEVGRGKDKEDEGQEKCAERCLKGSEVPCI